MHPGFRAAFNAAFTPALASTYARDLVGHRPMTPVSGLLAVA